MPNAEWWRFWRPQSGGIGGVIFGALLSCLLIVLNLLIVLKLS